MRDERYEDCEDCDERFVGEDAIRSYVREVKHGRRVCIDCAARRGCEVAKRTGALRGVVLRERA